MIERHHLKLIQTVEQLGSLTAAAQQLNLTQSALSHTVKKLEDQCETAIWTREGRTLKLTHAGQYLLRVSHRLLPQLEHADQVIRHFALGEKGQLRIGMECHPCFQWLLSVVEPYIEQWPGVDVDVKQKFQFGGMAALFSQDIDILVTPDPLAKEGVSFMPVFAYEQVLVVSASHALASLKQVSAEQLTDQTLYTYPVEKDRLDIYTEFLTPANRQPARHKTIEATDIMIQMVAAGRGVAALPKWLVDEYSKRFAIVPVRLGEQGIQKQIHLGFRDGEQAFDYLNAFVEMAKKSNPEL